MSEARELFERFSQKLWNRMIAANRSGDTISGGVLCEVGAALDDALKLATQPEPGAVPELPEYVTYASGPDHYRIDFVGGASVVMALADMDRVVEARECILGAREQARRAGS